jgi:hypothetical protein
VLESFLHRYMRHSSGTLPQEAGYRRDREQKAGFGGKKNGQEEDWRLFTRYSVWDGSTDKLDGFMANKSSKLGTCSNLARKSFGLVLAFPFFGVHLITSPFDRFRQRFTERAGKYADIQTDMSAVRYTN